ncbi:hypothetical protein NX029_26225 [Cytobacillus firmus]|nr:hypothetical protein [Cytobacillus firmus]
MKVKYIKVVAGKYEIILDNVRIGYVTEMVKGVWEAYGPEAKTVRTNSRKNATETFVERVLEAREEAKREAEVAAMIKELQEEEEAKKPASLKFAELAKGTFHYVKKEELVNTPEMSFDEWFLATHGLTPFEASSRSGHDLVQWYVECCGVDYEEAEGYAENDVDTWNDYLRAWGEVNPSVLSPEEKAVTEVVNAFKVADKVAAIDSTGVNPDSTSKLVSIFKMANTTKGEN